MSVTSGQETFGIILLAWMIAFFATQFLDSAFWRHRITSLLGLVAALGCAGFLLVTERSPRSLLSLTAVLPTGAYAWVFWRRPREPASPPRLSDAPDHLRRFNWGALPLAPIWALVYGSWKWALALVALPLWFAASVTFLTPNEVWGAPKPTVFLVAFAAMAAAAGVIHATGANVIAWPAIAGTYDELEYARAQRRWLWSGIAIDSLLLAFAVWVVFRL